MVQIDEHKRVITISIKGDTEDYWNYIRTLTRLIATQDNELRDKDTVYFATTLLEDMLPEPGQKVIIK